MGEYEVYATEKFEELYSTLEVVEQRWIRKIKQRLEENPSGKVLSYNWFREKKFENKRLLYLVDEDKKKILFVAFATKKDQQKTINFVKDNMDEFLKYLRKL